uniref:Uncharacterized protein n=1 Tax=Strombidium rassoulzadegani TaxID=1082188 RepID=A0A7S3CU66_9SPIT|mmetsp:Transcript_9132/g.15396  ORF Transcript_9132/g.15396 Transcript_9132/m.15396 type:complete len:116 (+) Transcript_9132:809-1156(+)
MYDQRLFNQTSGLDSGFGHEDDYNLYDKPLFGDRTAASIYKNIKKTEEVESELAQDGEQRHVRKVLGQAQFKADEAKDAGFDKSYSGRSKPVEFQKQRLETGEEPEFKGGLQNRK